MNLLRFAFALINAAYHLLREKYYLVALNHIGHDHPESWLVTHRMLMSRVRVNDFLRTYTDY